MKHPNDPGTIDMLPMPKKRGRKPSGKALTPAQKQARYRARKASSTVGVAVALRRLAELLSVPSPDLLERVQVTLLDLADQLDPQGDE